MKDGDALEKKLRSEEPRRLPEAWREEILETAMGAKEFGAREIIVELFPRPLMIGLAAAWVLILVLRVSMPGGDPAAVSDRLEGDRDREVDRAVLAQRVRVNVTGELEMNGTL